MIKESDLEKIENHIAKIKDENLRLENENNRLNFIIESFIREKDIVEIEKVNEILKKRKFPINLGNLRRSQEKK